MKAMVLEKHGDISSSPLVLKDLPLPEPKEGEVLLKIKCCAICRTDLHVIEAELPKEKLPLIPGHQIVGVVEKLGPGCKRLKEGDRIGVAWLRYTCGTCQYCKSGKENLCESARFTGYHEDGGFAEHTTINENFAYKIPDGIGDAEATPLLCAGIIGYRALKRSNLKPGQKLGIYGFGSSAHIVIQIALNRNCPVYVVTRGEKHRALAKEMGATWVGGPEDKIPEKVNSAIIFAPAGEIVPQALKSLEKGGTLALAGIYMSPVPEMTYEEHLFYEKNICSVTANTREDGKELFIEAEKIPIKPHITTYPFTEANQALQDLKSDKINGTGVLEMG
ncbi:zinc-dependent alcohol dehydrogenase family protein [Bdellovibrionota bacterium]